MLLKSLKKLISDYKSLLLIVVFFSSYSLITDLIFIFLGIGFRVLNLDFETFIANNIFLSDTIVCIVTTIIYGLIYFLFIKKHYQEEIFYNTREVINNFKEHLPLILVVVLGGIAITNLWFIVIDNFLMDSTFIAESLESFDSYWALEANESYIWSFLSIVIFGPIAEELLFRGIIFNIIKSKSNSILIASVISGIIFGLWHLEPVQVVYTAIMGITLGLLYGEAKDLKIVIIAHIINNLLSNLPDPLSGIYGYVVSISYIFIFYYIKVVKDMIMKHYSEDRMKILEDIYVDTRIFK